ncbi:hypothetical protein [robinz microvirus RP_56]|nr:hypothetical protein [robinz microvirus RP_56]
MATRGHSKGGSAHLTTPRSLTTLLAPSQKPLAMDPLAYLQQEIQEEAAYVRSHLNEANAIFGDRRTYRPDKTVSPPSALIRRATRIHVGVSRTIGRTRNPAKVRFAIPNVVGVCIRRAARRQVLHALNRTHRKGRGGGRRTNFWSAVKC